MFVPTSKHVVADRYELIEEIGRGSMGVIWRARQTNLGIECAIKFIHVGQAHDPELRRRFVREARAAASLNSPHSVHILDVDEWQGCLFIAMELLIGETLEARLTRVGRLSPEATLEVVDQVARGLNKAHAARLVHRDLKPDNIFLVDDEPLLVKILDFGIAKRLDAIAGTQTASGALLGTPGYMSPEQALASKNIDFRSDLWSLAVVVFRCLTGVEPFEGEGLGQILVEIVKGPLRKPSAINPHLPASLDEWWLRATQREPAARHSSATALVSDLRVALESMPVWPESAFEPTLGGDTFGGAPETLEPVLAAERRSNPAAMRYSMAMVPALVVSGWFIGRALWPSALEAWPTEHADQRGSAPVAFAVEPVTSAAPTLEPIPERETAEMGTLAPPPGAVAASPSEPMPAAATEPAAQPDGVSPDAVLPAEVLPAAGTVPEGTVPEGTLPGGPAPNVPGLLLDTPAATAGKSTPKTSTGAAPKSDVQAGAPGESSPPQAGKRETPRRTGATTRGSGGSSGSGGSASTSGRSRTRFIARDRDERSEETPHDASAASNELRTRRDDDPELGY